MSVTEAVRETSYLSRVVGLPPRDAAHVFDDWARGLLTRRTGEAVAGQLHLQVDPAALGVTELRSWWPLRSVEGHLRTARGRRLGAVRLELSVWSADRTELGLRLQAGRRWRPSDTYFAVGHAALGQLALELMSEALATSRVVDLAAGRAAHRAPVRPVLILMT